MHIFNFLFSLIGFFFLAWNVYEVLWWLIVIFSSIKLGVIEDQSNRTRLAKLLRFYSSNSDMEQTSLPDYIERMKEKQEAIYFVAGTSRSEVSALIPILKTVTKKISDFYIH